MIAQIPAATDSQVLTIFVGVFTVLTFILMVVSIWDKLRPKPPLQGQEYVTMSKLESEIKRVNDKQSETLRQVTMAQQSTEKSVSEVKQYADRSVSEIKQDMGKKLDELHNYTHTSVHEIRNDLSAVRVRVETVKGDLSTQMAGMESRIVDRLTKHELDSANRAAIAEKSVERLLASLENSAVNNTSKN